MVLQVSYEKFARFKKLPRCVIGLRWLGSWGWYPATFEAWRDELGDWEVTALGHYDGAVHTQVNCYPWSDKDLLEEVIQGCEGEYVKLIIEASS